MNYFQAWLICIFGTILSALGNGYETKYLIMSDANVTCFLLLAWSFGRKK